jgi:hypothetical protein
MFATERASAVARSLAEHVPVSAFGLVTAAVPVPEVVVLNGERLFPSKLVAVTSVPVKVLVGTATPARQVAATAAFAEPRIKLPEMSSPTLPTVPIFFSVFITFPYATDGVICCSTAAFRLIPPEADAYVW